MSQNTQTYNNFSPLLSHQILSFFKSLARKSTSIHKKNQQFSLTRSKIKIRQSWVAKIFEIFLKISKIFGNFEIFRKLDFSIFKGISIIFEKSSFRKFSNFSKISKIFVPQKIFSSFGSNFFHFRHFVLFFFIDRCKICPRSRFIYAKSAENATGKS